MCSLFLLIIISDKFHIGYLNKIKKLLKKQITDYLLFFLILIERMRLQLQQLRFQQQIIRMEHQLFY
jgi:hypothetical protein